MPYPLGGSDERVRLAGQLLHSRFVTKNRTASNWRARVDCQYGDLFTVANHRLTERLNERRLTNPEPQ